MNSSLGALSMKMTLLGMKKMSWSHVATPHLPEARRVWYGYARQIPESRKNLKFRLVSIIMLTYSQYSSHTEKERLIILYMKSYLPSILLTVYCQFFLTQIWINLKSAVVVLIALLQVPPSKIISVSLLILRMSRMTRLVSTPDHTLYSTRHF